VKRPTRIQRQRTSGWVLPIGSVAVDHSSRWANPFTVDEILAEGAASTAGEARAVAVHRFGRWLDGAGEDEHETRSGPNVSRAWMRAHLEDLLGKVLVCTCPVDELPCHADELARRAAERGVYSERAQLVAWISTHYKTVASVDAAEPMCPDVVYFSTAAGQLSWHLDAGDFRRHFDHLSRVPPDDPDAIWDQHETSEKYARIRQLRQHRAGSEPCT
jgi:hypothetical protein